MLTSVESGMNLDGDIFAFAQAIQYVTLRIEKWKGVIMLPAQRLEKVKSTLYNLLLDDEQVKLHLQGKTEAYRSAFDKMKTAFLIQMQGNQQDPFKRMKLNVSTLGMNFWLTHRIFGNFVAMMLA